jgi:cytoskeletal protein CcmA (bactofilin family)
MFNKNNGEKVTRIQAPRHDQVNGLLDKGCSFEGKLTFDGTVQINGDYAGEIYSDGTLVVGTEARLNAKVYVDTLIVYGKIEGAIEAKSRIEMHVPAAVTADLKTKNLSIEDGVIFQGSCQMERQAEQVTSTKSSDEHVAAPISYNTTDESEQENVLVV